MASEISKKNMYDMFSKSIKTDEAAFMNMKMDNGWDINFFQNSFFGSQHPYSSDFSIGQSTSEISLLIWYEASLLCISFF